VTAPAVVARAGRPEPAVPEPAVPEPAVPEPAVPEPAVPEVEVLVPTRNRPVELATTLAGLAAQEHPFDVLVSDQSDGPPSFDTPPAATLLRVLRVAGHRVRTVVHGRRHGVAEHRAALLGRSTARYALFLDDDVWLEPGTVARLHEAIVTLGCGLVGAALQGVSFLDDRRPAQLAPFERWAGRPVPERIAPDTPAWDRWMLHNAANPIHLAQQHVRPGERWVAYKIAWVAGCVLYDRAALGAVGGFDFWRDLPPMHCGEDVVVQRRMMARFGGAGILPSGAYHLESPTTIPDREHNASDLLVDAAVEGAVPGSGCQQGDTADVGCQQGDTADVECQRCHPADTPSHGAAGGRP
jgi:glycosyl transferase family 2